MKIISWDIGIKHLAYCIMDENHKIYKWEIINLLDDKKISCYKKECKNKSKYSCYINNQEIGFCGVHKKLHQEAIKKHIFIKFDKSNNKKQCEYICRGNKRCEKYGSWICNGHFCSSHKNQLIKKDENIVKLCPIKIQKVNKVNIDIVKHNMIKILDNMKYLLDVDHVVIENQPTLKNPRMKGIATTLYTWFLIRGQFDQHRIKKIKFVAPSNKLKINEDNTIKILSKAEKESEKYKLTKKLGIVYCKKLLDNEWLNWLNNLIQQKKKVDDLCDSMLLGVQYISKL